MKEEQYQEITPGESWLLLLGTFLASMAAGFISVGFWH